MLERNSPVTDELSPPLISLCCTPVPATITLSATTTYTLTHKHTALTSPTAPRCSYMKMEEETRANILPGAWLRSGDIAGIDADHSHLVRPGCLFCHSASLVHSLLSFYAYTHLHLVEI